MTFTAKVCSDFVSTNSNSNHDTSTSSGGKTDHPISTNSLVHSTNQLFDSFPKLYHSILFHISSNFSLSDFSSIFSELLS
jgi:hypothetical protein